MKLSAEYLCGKNETIDFWLEQLYREHKVDRVEALSVEVIDDELDEYEGTLQNNKIWNNFEMVAFCDQMIKILQKAKVDRCKEILNNWVDSTEDCEVAIAQLRSLQTGGTISAGDYDYIISNFDKLLED